MAHSKIDLAMTGEKSYSSDRRIHIYGVVSNSYVTLSTPSKACPTSGISMSSDEIDDHFKASKFLNGNLGATPLFFDSSLRSGFIPAAKIASVYFLVFSFLPVLIGMFFDVNPNLTLIGLSTWGACYFFFATWTATSTSSRVESDCAKLWSHLGSLDESNRSREIVFSKYIGPLPNLIALLAALFGLVPTVGALVSDLGYIEYSFGWSTPPKTAGSIGPLNVQVLSADTMIWEWCFFACGFFILYFTAARCTFVGTFVISATRQVSPSIISGCFDPKYSAPITYCKDISRSLLLFWAGISISIATLPVIFSGLGDFLQVVVSTTVFFSIGVGTTVYLISERQISRSVRDAETEKLENIHRQMKTIQKRSKPDEKSERVFKFLQAQREVLTAKADVTSYVLVLASLILPLIGTIVKIVVDWQNI